MLAYRVIRGVFHAPGAVLAVGDTLSLDPATVDPDWVAGPLAVLEVVPATVAPPVPGEDAGTAPRRRRGRASP